MRVCWSWVFSAVLALGACASLPPVTNESTIDCLAKSTCYAVKVDNGSNRYDIELGLNGVKYGDIGSYGSALYTIPSSRLVHGSCLVASAKFPQVTDRPVLRSTEECINPGQYFRVDITVVPFKVWLVPYRQF